MTHGCDHQGEGAAWWKGQREWKGPCQVETPAQARSSTRGQGEMRPQDKPVAGLPCYGFRSFPVSNGKSLKD